MSVLLLLVYLAAAGIGLAQVGSVPATAAGVAILAVLGVRRGAAARFRSGSDAGTRERSDGGSV
ncbi:hypothetical protein Val02_20250 [Virgisporangium aliadipatigenens]|uniref:Uncharacterized protein n=1 Tax=Virgisporangium aliadipatigenens TaxID=741659 RepID=A0A8J3YH57_9ACTN|nr:hypothetical protein [Virgisporangium aliadipatigenens]GIJ45139.1 hypothetical protein Val02_20250 [Virgisporangium aliadipatigenens]